MITRAQAIEAADNAANVVWRACEGPQAFHWHEAFQFSPAVMAQYVAEWPERPASQLYAFAVAEDDAERWHKVAPVLRVTLEVFRATFLALLAEMRAADMRAEGARIIQITQRGKA
jgi:hypothetical protein